MILVPNPIQYLSVTADGKSKVVSKHMFSSEDRHGKKPVLPPLQVQWSPEVDKRERQEREEREEKEELAAEETLSRKGSGNTRKSPKQFNTSTPRRFF